MPLKPAAEDRKMAEEKKQGNKNEKTGYSSRYDEEEETYMYDIRKPMEFINEGEHGVFDIRKQTGINTAKSVFDKGAIFKS